MSRIIITEQSVRFDTTSTPSVVTVNSPPAKINEKTFNDDVERALQSPPARVRPGPIPSGNSSLTMVTGWADDVEASSRSEGGIVRHFKRDINTAGTEILLIACAFISGVIDSAAFNAWGSFANMQTGNVVFLALGVSGQPPTPPNRWAKSLLAIGAFAIGVLFFRYASAFLRPLRRSTLVASFTLQTTAILISSILVQTGVVDSNIEASTHGVHWIQVLPITILAFQAAGQIVTSRLLGIDEIPTIVLTTLLCDLLMDKKLFSFRPRWKLTDFRTRRLLTLLAAFSGAMLSGGLSKVGGLSASLWLATGIKAIVTVCFLLWRGEKDEDFDDN
ncbi:hypothetical protein MGYG_02543 [Nannizzia gypsea CBS 118893]|uniref:DUF1275 domain-containing protein n=1 Tax=Arthroderma gypseum (strain ATCC MYA-4604 / CBS 118893) TaxID=535722 RepID=E4UN70_ARTGP|nr:hypothetical protein MGYG_02543 [Nannizzia gypsea CBS 118893]EFQ99531.1 hypothetical protein MGYG_02543 [Nannizzia gypsea CBS 118893]